MVSEPFGDSLGFAVAPGFGMRTEDIYKERLARFLDLAEAAQDASDRADTMVLKVTYAKLASQWVELAQLAQGIIDRNRKLSGQADDPKPDPQIH